MPPIIYVNETFKIAIENGNKVIEIEPGEHDVDDRIAVVAVDILGVATHKEIKSENIDPLINSQQPEPEPEPEPEQKTVSKRKVKANANTDTQPSQSPIEN
ncbi:hypothetical protein [Acinetobacter sp. 243_ASPC]|uniref:hypothetical protein n=1 Tax=Acinetobacter sp. 243_ASPC TaxID=1579345 RepID=UPI000660BA57|nr:hypothetical protein [Acinetobacter sp. 243_ASPC]